MKIKVCGLKHPDNIRQVAALGPDYAGFICYEQSPRYIAGLDAGLVAGLDKTITKTGVFVNETQEGITGRVKELQLDAIQLHGQETAEFCAFFKGKVEVIKAFGLHDDFDFEALRPYTGVVDYFLFDTQTKTHGGSGKTFDWGMLDNYRWQVPFFLSGGLSLDNLEEIKQISNPMFVGVDLNSRFETAPGLKDLDKLTKAIALIKSESAHEIRS
jgi:phosphoribosylanthranilate isomerase